jgi:hypothetical protein
VSAQNFKFGKVSEAELSQTSHPVYTEATAAVLFRKTVTKFNYSQDEGFKVETQFHERVKIYSKEGYDFANVQVSLYKNGSASERVSNLKGITYTLVNGKVNESKLKSSGIFDEKASKTRNIKKFTMPDVQDGAILEYRYTVTSPFISSIDEFRFQEEVPVNNVEMVFFAPEYLSYRTHGKGAIPLNIQSESRERKIRYRYESNETGRAVGGERGMTELDLRELGYIIQLKDVSPLKKEPYAGNYENFFSALQFELAYTKFPNSPVRNYTTTWEEVSKKIYKSDNFGKELEKSNVFKSDLKNVIADLKTPHEKAAAIYSFVKTRMTWNEYYGVYCDLGVKKAYKDRVGNVADINLILTGMFRAAGLQCSPVLISSKSNGIPIFPTLNGFNYVVAGVKIDGKTHLYDAADKNGVVDILKTNLLNWKGRMVKEDGSSRLVEVYPRKIALHNALITVRFTEDLTIEGNAKNRFSGHYARRVRVKYDNVTEDEQFKKMDNAHKGIDLIDLNFKDMKNSLKPVTMEYNFEMEDGVDEIGGKLYISPLFHLGMTENVFKSEERAYPIDFVYPYEDRYSVSIEIPEGYTVESLPESLVINLSQGMGSFKYGTSVGNGKITVSVQNAIKMPVIDAGYYKDLQEYFKMIVEKETEKIVLKKE